MALHSFRALVARASAVEPGARRRAQAGSSEEGRSGALRLPGCDQAMLPPGPGQLPQRPLLPSLGCWHTAPGAFATCLRRGGGSESCCGRILQGSTKSTQQSGSNSAGATRVACQREREGDGAGPGRGPFSGSSDWGWAAGHSHWQRAQGGCPARAVGPGACGLNPGARLIPFELRSRICRLCGPAAACSRRMRRRGTAKISPTQC